VATVKKSAVKGAREFDLRNEGYAHPTFVTRNEDGSSTFAVRLDGLPAPEKTFSCDGLNVLESTDGFRLCFTQSKAFGEGIRALLEIQISAAAAAGFSETLDALNRKDGPSVEFISVEEEPTSSITLSANFVRLSSNSFASVLDFYFASPFSMEEAGRSQNMHFKDVVRIQASEQIFFSLVKYFLRTA
jgi:hypothetical protein